MKSLPVNLGSLSLGLLLCAGCTVGKNSVLFTTKTSLAIDIDTKPPTLDIGYGRKEGTLAPVYENGGVLPQMASFHGGGGWFRVNAGQSFAAGNAAVILAKYFSFPSDPAVSPVVPTDEITNATPVGLPSGKRSRYFFGTDSSFGVKVNFGLETGGWPDAMSVGYKRKELAFVPIKTITHEGKPTDTLPSLLATSGLGVRSTNKTETDVGYNQFFATGRAADYLAAQSAVRQTLGHRIVRDPALQQRVDIKLQRSAGLDAQAEAEALIDQLSPAQLDNAAHVARAVGLFSDENLAAFVARSSAEEKKDFLKRSLVGEGADQWARVRMFLQVLQIGLQ